MDLKYDFSGWATRNDLVCSDGRTIRKDAFKHCDGKTVPLVWNHRHDEPANILGRALLENRADGVYAYCFFNDTESGRAAKELVQHGDVESLSIYANGLKQTASRDVMHGDIKEVSLVVAGANPGAFIDFVDMAHTDEGFEQEVVIGTGEGITLYHAYEKPATPRKIKSEEEEKSDEDSEETIGEVLDTLTDKQKNVVYALIGSAMENSELKHSDQSKSDESEEDDSDETVQDVIDTMTEKQKTVMYALIGAAMEGKDSDDDDEPDSNSDKSKESKGGNNIMKHNVFEKEEAKDTVLTHSDQQAILELARRNSVGTLRTAINIFAEESDTLQHGIDNIESLFPDFEDIRPGAPELVTRDQGWVNVVMKKVHKSPISRIRTRQVDARGNTIRSNGYNDRTKKKALMGDMSVITRTTDPQTVYCITALHRDDIVDIKGFDVVQYQYNVMRESLNEEVAIAIMVGDGREAGTEMKISEDHIRSIWNDNEVYTIHQDVDIAAAKAELQGTNTGANFGENYIYAEAIVNGAMFAREGYKGTGTPDFFCTPHMLNVMLLARDLNGRRIYTNKADLAAALNVGEIHTAEQFEGLVRTDKESKKHKLLGIFVNLTDYTVGSTKGGEITRFNQFDIDFNQHKYLIEARLSGALTRIASAIALEEPVA